MEISRRNAVEALLRHDWTYRWKKTSRERQTNVGIPLGPQKLKRFDISEGPQTKLRIVSRPRTGANPWPCVDPVIGAVYTLPGGHSQRLRTDYDGAARTQSRVSVSRARVCISQAGEVPLNRLLPGLVPLAPDKSARGTEFGFQLSTKRSMRPNVFFNLVSLGQGCDGHQTKTACEAQGTGS